MSNASIYNYLKEHKDSKYVSFHIPGHKSSKILEQYGYKDFLKNIIEYDITEIYGADNLFNARGIIKEAQENFKNLYGVKDTFFLVNGTTGGIISSILASVNPGKKIIVGRDSHKSVRNALILGDIEPVYVCPVVDDKYNIPMGIDPQSIEKSLAENPEVDAVMITYPNFYGVCSDIEEISKIVHRYNKIFIVDEAHGSHLKFSDSLPKSALDAGADIVIQSIHKTLLSFTQSSVLHVNSDRVNIDRLKEMLQINQSSSPSYLLMASLDICREILERDGIKLFNNFISRLDKFYNKVKNIEGLKIIDKNIIGSNYVKDFDITKFNIDMSKLGISGNKLGKILIEEYGIHTEMVTINNVLGFSTIANEDKDFHILFNALDEISKKYKNNNEVVIPRFEFKVPKKVISLKQAVYQDKSLLELEKCIGKTSGGYIIPYPPGIPLVCPGEEITSELITHINDLLKYDIEIIGLKNKGKEIFMDVIES